MFKKLSFVLACMLLFSVTPVMAQQVCDSDCNGDHKVNLADLVIMKEEFNRTDCYNGCSGTLSPLGRWCDQGNGTVKDMGTGLVWLKDASCMGQMDWFNAIEKPIANLRNGDCGGTLTDGSEWGEWRLPSYAELCSLNQGIVERITDANTYFFTGVQNAYYWSSLTASNNPTYAWMVNLRLEAGMLDLKTNIVYYVWPIRLGYDIW